MTRNQMTRIIFQLPFVVHYILQFDLRTAVIVLAGTTDYSNILS